VRKILADSELACLYRKIDYHSRLRKFGISPMIFFKKLAVTLVAFTALLALSSTTTANLDRQQIIQIVDSLDSSSFDDFSDFLEQ
jgi:hypothetical protein